MMAKKGEKISYSINDFMKYAIINKTMPDELRPYCLNTTPYGTPNLNDYLSQLTQISVQETANENSDMTYKKHIKNYINKLSQKNYDDVINDIMSLNLSTKENMFFLANELMVNSISCKKAINRDKTNDNTKSISDLCTDAMIYFSNTLTKNGETCFFDELIRICKRYFMDFVNIENGMEENNESASDNYKGFMMTVGILYKGCIIPSKIIFDWIDSIKATIFCSLTNQKTEQIQNSATIRHGKMFGSQRSGVNVELYDTLIYFDTETVDITERKCYRNQNECTNFYKGYVNLMDNVLSLLENKIQNIHTYESEKILKLCELANNFITNHQDFCTLNLKYKSTNKSGKEVRALNGYCMLTNNDIGEKLNTITESLTKHSKMTRYVQGEIK